MLSAIIVSLIAGVAVYLIGTIFDKTPNNRYAGIAGLVVAALVFLSRMGISL